MVIQLKDPNGQIARWLAEYNFTVLYRPGSMVMQMGCLDQQTRQACLEELELPCGYCPKCAKKTEIMGSGVIVYFSAITTRQSSPINVPTSQDNIDWWTDPGIDRREVMLPTWHLEEKQRIRISIGVEIGTRYPTRTHIGDRQKPCC